MILSFSRLARFAIYALATAGLPACSSNAKTSGPTGSGGSTASVTTNITTSGTSGTGGFVPAEHPAAPQVLFLGGPVLAKPKVQLIAYASDADLGDLEAFLQELTTTAYWSETTSEYGVGPLTILPTIKLTTPAPATLTSADLTASLAANTTGSSPAWGPVDPSTIYVFVTPLGTTVTSDGGSCVAYDGLHGETTIAGMQIPYALSTPCPGFDGDAVAPLQQRTVSLSHEIVEAATDPLPNSDPAYGREDQDDFFWTIATGGELADMCEINLDSYVVPTGSRYMVQRSWSNAAAKQSRNPCVPRDPEAVYFNSFAALGDVSWMVQKPYVATHGVQIPVGQSKVVDVTLSSSAPTSKPWTVTAYDYDKLLGGGAPSLTLTLDKNTGSNGDTLHLTVAVNDENTKISGAGFILISDYGKPGDADFAETISMGVVVP